MSAEFEAAGSIIADTTLERVGDGKFRGVIPERWRMVYAFGGVLAATALRAISQALDRPDFVPVAVHTTFCKPVQCGPVVVDVELVRVGSSVVQAIAKLREREGDPVAVWVSATLGRYEAAGEQFKAAAFPVAPPPEGCTPPKVRELIRLPFMSQADWTESPETSIDAGASPSPRAVAWQRYQRAPRLPDGTMDRIATVLVFADNLAGPLNNYLGASGPRTVSPLTLEMSVQFMGVAKTEWILMESRLEHLAGGYAFGSLELWDAEGTLLGIASQRALVRLPGNDKRASTPA